MQILGIYGIYDKVKLLGTLKRLQNSQLHLPVVITLESSSYSGFAKISIFPAFYSIGRHPAIHQVLAESFDKDPGSYTLADAGRISQLSIYLVDSCDIPSIHALAKNMNTSFPKIDYLTFCFENSCEIVSFLLIIIILELRSIPVWFQPSQEVKKIVPLFPNLRYLKFNHWYPKPRRNGKIPENIEMTRWHMKDWELACPELISVSFMDGSTLQKGTGE